MVLSLVTQQPQSNMFADKKLSHSTAAALHLSQDAVNSKNDCEDDDHLSLVETDSVASFPNTIEDDGDCDACIHCNDVCNSENCSRCLHKRKQQCPNVSTCSSSRLFPCNPLQNRSSSKKNNHSATREYTMCEVRRHNHEGSAWIRMGDQIYDATSFLKVHPAGSECILRRAGGLQDCTTDFQFHSKRGQTMFKKHLIGTVRPCTGCAGSNNAVPKNNKDWWMLW